MASHPWELISPCSPCLAGSGLHSLSSFSRQKMYPFLVAHDAVCYNFPPNSQSTDLKQFKQPLWMRNCAEEEKRGGGGSCLHGKAGRCELVSDSNLHSLCAAGRIGEVMDVLEKGEISASRKLYAQLICKCGQMKHLSQAKRVHALLAGRGLESDSHVGSGIVEMYVKCGSLEDAQIVHNRLPQRNVGSWNVMILGYAQKQQGELALSLYAQMQVEGVYPDNRSFVGVVKACGMLATLEEGLEVDGKHVKMLCLEKGRSIHSQVARSGFESNTYVGNTLIDMYAKCGSMVDAHHVFQKLPYRDVVSWTAMVLGYAEKDDAEVALGMYAQMQQEGIAADERMFVGALKACICLATLEGRTEVDGKCVEQECLQKGRSIHLQIVKAGFASDMFVGTALIDLYSKFGSIAEARCVFDSLPRCDMVCWTVMILGYAEQSSSEEAFKLYLQMRKCGLRANSATFVSMLKACGNTAALETGKEIHAEIGRMGLETSDTVVATALVDMYAKCGSMVEAQEVFDRLPRRNVVTWSALIAGYARQGKSDLVFHFFQRMMQEGIQPNEVTFLSVLTACSHAGLLDKGQFYFDAMVNKPGLAPTVEHYNCMVDLLGRAGQLDEAMAVVETMPFQPNLVTWMTLLSACRKWTNVEVGRRAFDCAMKSNDKRAATYVLMSNIYADADMWEEHQKIQALRDDSQAWKEPGRSWWTEVGGMVHTFLVGDANHPQSRDIYEKLNDLSCKMEEGQVPALDRVVRRIS